ncbi:uncharacterized protein LOC129602442 [Paramacrobiotus metropolitanus]|uniref:uncharacterized protein LOC129602442 n=1 Tax=Paramacrobiotus metropolitanus TaxID=2943436 RepID=UPI0024465D40|nr:uncharacterized protein LOC129602442 [Paramacrobiotus metropolitanus]
MNHSMRLENISPAVTADPGEPVDPPAPDPQLPLPLSPLAAQSVEIVAPSLPAVTGGTMNPIPTLFDATGLAPSGLAGRGSEASIGEGASIELCHTLPSSCQAVPVRSGAADQKQAPGHSPSISPARKRPVIITLKSPKRSLVVADVSCCLKPGNVPDTSPSKKRTVQQLVTVPRAPLLTKDEESRRDQCRTLSVPAVGCRSEQQTNFLPQYSPVSVVEDVVNHRAPTSQSQHSQEIPSAPTQNRQPNSRLSMESDADDYPIGIECPKVNEFSPGEDCSATASPVPAQGKSSFSNRCSASTAEDKKRSTSTTAVFVQKKRCQLWRDAMKREMARQAIPSDLVQTIPVCFDCYETGQPKRTKHRNKAKKDCRFNNARLRCIRLTKDTPSESDAAIIPAAKLDLVNDGDIKDCYVAEEGRLWFSDTLSALLGCHGSNGRRLRSVPNAPRASPEEASYVLSKVGTILLDLLNQHESILAKHAAPDDGGPAVKSIPFGMTESCDVCLACLFNAHFVCLHCGYCVCPECYSEFAVLNRSEAEEAPAGGSIPRGEVLGVPCDNRGWHLCPTKPAGSTLPKSSRSVGGQSDHHLLPTRIIPLEAVRMVQSGITQFLALSADGSVANSGESIDWEQRDFLCNGQVLLLQSPNGIDTEAFRAHWSKGLPVVIAGVGQSLTDPKVSSQGIWQPSWFAAKFGEEKVDLIDCGAKPHQRITGKKHMDFWKGFSATEGKINFL